MRTDQINKLQKAKAMIKRSIDNFWRDTRGNFAIMFGLTIIPMFVMFGVGIDFYKGLSFKARLDAAADAAAIAAINAAQTWVVANPGSPVAQSYPIGVAQGYKVFYANAGSEEAVLPVTQALENLSITLAPSSSDPSNTQVIVATVTYNTQVATNFGGVVGVNSIDIKGRALSSLTMSTYLDFYVLVDSSGSMGLPTDPEGQAALGYLSANLKDSQDVNIGDDHPGYTQGCTFACHGSSIDAPGVSGAMPSNCNPSGVSSGPLESYALPSNATYPYQLPVGTPGSTYSTLGFPNGSVIESSANGFCGFIGYMLTRKPSIVGGSLYSSMVAAYPAYANSIPLRADAVGGAIQNLLATALSTENNVTHIANEFRIGIYPFVNDAIEAAPLSYSLNTSSPAYAIAGHMASYLDQGNNTINSHNGYNFQDTMKGVLPGHGGNDMGAGGTHFENLWFDLGGTTTGVTSTSASPGPSSYTYSAAKGAISGATILKGTGSGAGPATPKGFIFLVTDGAENLQTFTTSSGFNGSTPTQMNSNAAYSSLCSKAKASGYTMAVLYIPYVPINPVNHAFAGDEDTKVNNNVSSFPVDLSTCASPGYFYTASSAAAINAAMQAMFKQATQPSRLIN